MNGLHEFMKKFEEFEQRIIQKEEERIKALKDKDMWYNKSVALEKEFNQFQETGLLQKSSKFKKSSKRKSN